MKRKKRLWVLAVFVAGMAALVVVGVESRRRSIENERRTEARVHELFGKVVEDCKRCRVSPGVVESGERMLVTLPDSSRSIIELGSAAGPTLQGMIVDSGTPEEQLAGDVARACFGVVMAEHVETNVLKADENIGVALCQYTFWGNRKPTLHERGWRVLKGLTGKK